MSVVGLCRDCRWWKPNDDRAAGDCELTYLGAITPPHPESKAFASSWCGDGSILHTDADFGCVQFEAKS